MFNNVIFSAVAFIIALGLLISIHEYGHFWVARKVGIKVLRYSIGFGKSLWSRVGKVDNTEYVIAALPLGGYVKMLDEREGNVAPEERHRAFNNQPLWARSAVVAAGPIANFLLAILAYWAVMMMGISGVAPLVGDPVPDSPVAQAGFENEDRILAVNGESTPSWTEARLALLDASLNSEELVLLQVETVSGQEVTRTLDTSQSELLRESGDPIGNLGFSAWRPHIEPIVGEVLPDGAAADAGMQVGDLITSVQGEPISSWFEFVEWVQPRAGQVLTLELERAGEPLTLNITPRERTLDNGQTVGLVGISQNQSAELFEKARVTVQYAPVEAFSKALVRTWDMSVLTLKMLIKLVTGQASLDNISGPVSMAQFAGQSASIGLDHYINFIAMISISLAVLNLLPIPMLDGGHLLYFAIEGLTGRAVPERVQIWGQQLGLILLGGLMMIAFYKDIGRLIQ